MGIDIQRIVEIESLPWEHFCPVCQLLVNPTEALQSMCGHLYCKRCLTFVDSTTRACPYDGYLVTATDAKPLVESNKALADTIGKTVVYCLYRNSGCTWVGSLADSWFHCYGCAFGNWSGINIPHRQRQEHVQGDYTQASVAMATSQTSAQAYALAPAMMTQEQWYQQPYQQYYQNYVGDYMLQQPMQPQSFAPHSQVIYVQAAVHYVAQTDSQMQPQPQSLAMHQPHDAFPSPPDNTVQDSVAHNTIGQCQSNQPHASWTVQNPQPIQTNQGGAPPNDMIVYHQDHFPEQVSHVCPPHSLPTIQKQQPFLQSQLTRDHYKKQMVLKYGGGLAPESSDIHSSQQPFSNPSLSQQHREASTTHAVHNQMNHEGPSYHPHIALQEHQPMSPILGLQPNMNHFSATPPQVSLPAVEEDDMQRTQKQIRWVSWGQDKVIHIYGNKDDEAVMEETLTTDSINTDYGVNRAAEVTTIKLDHKLKGKLIDDSAESVHRSSFVMGSREIKGWPLGKQMVEENVGNDWEDLAREEFFSREKGISDDPSLDGIPLRNPTLLDQDGLRQLSKLRPLSESSRACSAGSLDRGFDQGSLIRTQEKHDIGFELRHALRSSPPSMYLGEGQFRHGTRSPISEHLGMPSHGYGSLGGRSTFHRSEFKGIGSLQMGEKVIAADMIGPVDSNGLRLGDVGSQGIYTLQGFPGDGGSFPGDWATKHDGNLGFHSQTKEHQQKSMDDRVSMVKHNEKKHKMTPSGSSQFGNQNKNEESRSKGSG